MTRIPSNSNTCNSFYLQFVLVNKKNVIKCMQLRLSKCTDYTGTQFTQIQMGPKCSYPGLCRIRRVLAHVVREMGRWVLV